jgi:hypothetical protein
MKENEYLLHHRLSLRSLNALRVWLFSYILANINEPETRQVMEMWFKKV